MAIPFVRALSRASADRRVVVLARRGPGAIFRAARFEVVSRAGSLAGDARAVRRLRAEQAWLLPNSFRAALTVFLGGAHERIGYATDRRGALLTHAVPPPPPSVHQLRDYDRLLDSRGIAPDMGPPRLDVPAAAQERAESALGAASLSGAGGSRVFLAPGAAFSWTKRWPPERWGELAARLGEGGARPALVIGPGEEAIAAAAAAASGRPLPVLGADLDPAELAGLLKRADVVVSNDSGPMHLAAAVGTPVVAIFGPTDPGRTGPTGVPSRILDRYVFCSPCYLKECPYGHECMKEIAVGEVARAVEEMLVER